MRDVKAVSAVARAVTASWQKIAGTDYRDAAFTVEWLASRQLAASATDSMVAAICDLRDGVLRAAGDPLTVVGRQPLLTFKALCLMAYLDLVPDAALHRVLLARHIRLRMLPDRGVVAAAWLWWLSPAAPLARSLRYAAAINLFSSLWGVQCADLKPFMRISDIVENLDNGTIAAPRWYYTDAHRRARVRWLLSVAAASCSATDMTAGRWLRRVRRELHKWRFADRDALRALTVARWAREGSDGALTTPDQRDEVMLVVRCLLQRIWRMP